MSNQAFYIPSGGIGEIEYDTEEATRFNEDKAVPFLKFTTDLIDTLSRYRNQTRLGRYERYPQLAKEILETASGLANSYLKIKDYSEELFCTGDIPAIDYCLEVYRQYLNNEPFDVFYGVDGK